MAITLNLPPELEQRLANAARRRGMPIDQYTLQLLHQYLTDGTAVDLARRGIGPEQAANLRARLKPFAEDWDRPDMDAYDAL